MKATVEDAAELWRRAFPSLPLAEVDSELRQWLVFERCRPTCGFSPVRAAQVEARRMDSSRARSGTARTARAASFPCTCGKQQAVELAAGWVCIPFSRDADDDDSMIATTAERANQHALGETRRNSLAHGNRRARGGTGCGIRGQAAWGGRRRWRLFCLGWNLTVRPPCYAHGHQRTELRACVAGRADVDAEQAWRRRLGARERCAIASSRRVPIATSMRSCCARSARCRDHASSWTCPSSFGSRPHSIRRSASRQLTIERRVVDDVAAR